MRFISPIGAYRIVVIHDKTQADSDGFTRTVEPGYTVEFKQGLLTPYERKLARERLHFPGGVVDRQNVDGSPYDYIGLAGVFDTEWIEDEKLRERVEQKLLTNPGLGRADDFVLVEQPRQPAPWPSYDALTVHGRRTPEHVAQKNLEIAEATGVSVDDLVSYERENRNDARIIEAYEQAQAPAPEPEEELVRA